MAVAIDVVGYILLEVPFTSLYASGLRQQAWVQVLGLLAHGATVVALLGVAQLAVVSRRRYFHDQQALEVTASASTDWLWETDDQFRYTYCSAGVVDLLGHSPGDIVGQPIEAFVAERDESRLTAGLRSCMDSGVQQRDIDTAWRHRDGHLVTLRGSVSPMLDEDSRVVGLRGNRRLVLDGVDPLRTERRRLAEVITNESLRIALQPIVSIADGRLAGVEALSRFNDGRGPDVWFREARATGQSLELDRLAFTRAMSHLGDLPPEAYLSVNASPELVLDPCFTIGLIDVHREWLSRLVIEITEHERIGDYAALNRSLRPLRELGVRVAVDDAGAGYASLTHILQLRPDIIKIDRDLLTDLEGDSARRALVTALVLIALDLGATVTAEGIETAAQMDALNLLAVDSAQGYFLARPDTDPYVWHQWWTHDWSHAPAARVLGHQR